MDGSYDSYICIYLRVKTNLNKCRGKKKRIKKQRYFPEPLIKELNLIACTTPSTINALARNSWQGVHDHVHRNFMNFHC